MGEVYKEEILKAHVPLVKHFSFVLGTTPNHSQGMGTISITKKNVERQIVQNEVENAQKRASDLELEVQNLNSIIQNQEETNTQLHNKVQSQRQLIEDQELALRTQRDQMKQNIEIEMKRQMANLLGNLSFSGSNVSSK